MRSENSQKETTATHRYKELVDAAAAAEERQECLAAEKYLGAAHAAPSALE